MALVVDIPFHHLEKREGAPRLCTKMTASGRACGREALEGKDVCGVHYRWSDIEEKSGVPFPDDPMGVQEMLARTAALVAFNALSIEKARAVIDLCRLMMGNLRRM